MNRNYFVIFVAPIILFLFFIIHTAPSPQDQTAPTNPELRVLFIGNSLTYSNDLPSIVEALAEASGRKRPAMRAVVFANYSLEDHWNQGEARRAIARGGWDVVVLQQGPSASTEGRQSLLEYARRFAEEIRRVRAEPALYMVWPSVARIKDFDGVSESYRQAARDVGGLLFPAGEAWRSAWRRDPNLKLYSPDGLHPTVAGSYLAALVIYEQLYGQSFKGLPSELKLSTGAKIKLPEDQIKLMQDAAAEANKKFGSRAALMEKCKSHMAISLPSYPDEIICGPSGTMGYFMTYN